MTFEPLGIASKVEDAMVQKEPAAPVYSEQSFVICSVWLRGAFVLMLGVLLLRCGRRGRETRLPSPGETNRLSTIASTTAAHRACGASVKMVVQIRTEERQREPFADTRPLSAKGTG